MSIKYGLYKTPLPKDREETSEIHARFIKTSRTKMKRLCELVSARTAFSGSEVKGVLDAFVFVFKLDLSAGFIIELEGIGTFFPKLVSTTVKNEKGEKDLKVKVKTVGFRCAKELRESIKIIPVEQVRPLRTFKFTDEERIAKILTYVKKNRSFTTRDVMAFNHCSKALALADIHLLIEQKKIISIGGGKSATYIRSYPDENKE